MKKIIKKTTPLVILASLILALGGIGFAGAADTNQVKSVPDVEVILNNIANFALGIITIIAVIIFILAGGMWMTSGGDSDKIKTARTWIIYAVVGLLIAFGGWALIKLVTTTFLGSAVTPEING